MEGFAWIGTLVVGGLAGWVAARHGSSRAGALSSILLGIAGAVLLNFALIRITGSIYGGPLGQLLVAALGAGVLIGLFRVVGGHHPG